MSNVTTPDPRPLFTDSLDQIERLFGVMQPHHVSRPTPCGEYDVSTLLAHLVAVLRKLTIVRGGGDFAQVADPAVDVAADGRDAFRAARAELEQAWAPEEALEVNYTLPYGRMNGRDLLDVYTHEFTVHAWDLCHGIGGIDDGLDPLLAGAALDWYTTNVPADNRPEGGPFGPVTVVGDDAGPYARLAAFVGRLGS